VRLTTSLHDRDAAGMTYVYPVVSRRAGGVSVGINLNPNNACNWRCVYCQVPGLVAGKGPPIDLDLLERELGLLLEAIVRGDYLERHVPEGARRLVDVAFSGNGEPTSSPQFVEAIERVGRVLERLELAGRIALVLITNGSLVHLPAVREGLAALARLGGVAWFKLDSATEEGRLALNDARLSNARVRENLIACARAIPTWVQTLALARRGAPPSAAETEAYLAFLAGVLAEAVPLRGVLLYGIARPSWQPEAQELAPLPAAWMEAFAERIRALGLEVRVSL
jgi:wyosine [tRNA(Phe)-imidazoG37] synthetase (radical SAM superfamily)